MPLQNSWIGYITRSYQQIKQAVLLKFQNQVPEMTDLSENNPYVKQLSIWGGLIEMLGYYVDAKGRETYLSTAKRFESGIKIAQLFDYRAKGAVAATVDLLFYFDTPVTADVFIPQGTEVQTNDGIKFFTTEDATILQNTTEITVPAIQQEAVASSVLGITTGNPSQLVEIPDSKVVFRSSNVVINLINYTEQDTLGYSISTDTHYIAGLNENGNTTIEFGDGVSGVIPPIAQNINVSYAISEGLLGNVAENTITNIISSISVPSGFTLLCTNPLRASGGANPENLTALKKHIPLSTRTLLRAVTRQDYKDIAELVPGVSKAAIDFQCGKTVDVYIAPEGGGQANSGLISDTLDFFEDKRMVTTRVRVFSAGEIKIIFDIFVKIRPNYVKTAVVTAIKNNISAFVSVAEQDIKGTVHLNDIVQIVENTEGVDYSEFNVMKPVPYARPLNGTTPVLNWTRDILPSSTTTIKWRILFINATTFQVIKGGDFIGNFSVNTLLNFGELEFKVNGTYSIGNTWEFYTYKYFGTVALQELSVPQTFPSDITISVSGGI